MDAALTREFPLDETPDWLARRAERSPTALALRAEGSSLDYRSLDGLAARAAGTLRGLGVRRGDRVATLMPTGVHFAALLHATLRLGAALVPINTRLSAVEIGFILDDASPRAFVLSQRFRDLGEPLSRARSLPTVLVGDFGSEKDALLDGPAQGAGAHRLPDLAALVYTSGTTGTPKGAMLTRANFFYGAVGSAFGLGTVPQDRWLLCMPLFHVGGLSILLRATLYGIGVIAQSGFSPPSVLEAIDAEGATIASFVPTMLQKLMEHRAGPYGKLRFALLGGGPAPQDLLRRAVDQGIPIAPTYGLTETASQAATLSPWEVPQHIGSAGRPLFLTEIGIESGGRRLPPGEPGEILVRGPTVSPGYWRRPDATRESFGSGFLHTGDVGYQDEDGYLYVLDRRQDLIVSGGENVYPAEVEDALLAHPAVADAGVYPIDDAVWGKVPGAAVVLREGAVTDTGELSRFLRVRLAGYKLPRQIRFVESLPRNQSGKLMRRLLAPEVER